MDDDCEVEQNPFLILHPIFFILRWSMLHRQRQLGNSVLAMHEAEIDSVRDDQLSKMLQFQCLNHPMRSGNPHVVSPCCPVRGMDWNGLFSRFENIPDSIVEHRLTEHIEYPKLDQLPVAQLERNLSFVCERVLRGL